jgi:hypothetical protein
LPASQASRALGTVGTVTAVLVAAVFAVQMAVDGVTLKVAIDAWIGAVNPGGTSSSVSGGREPAVDRERAGRLLPTRSGHHNIDLGLSVAFGRRYPTWLGWIGVPAGTAIAAGGTVTAHTGFSA